MVPCSFFPHFLNITLKPLTRLLKSCTGVLTQYLVKGQANRIFMEPLLVASTIVSTANMAVLGILIVVFVRIYLKAKAQLPLGMIFFSGLLTLHNVIGVYAYFSMMELYAVALLPYLLAVHVAELAGVLVLLKITLQ